MTLGKIWRRILCPDDWTFEDLSSSILKSVQFDSDHLYEFKHKNRFGHTVHVAHYYCSLERSIDKHAHEVRIGDLNLQEGMSMEYIYDFGDDWRFTLVLEKVNSQKTAQKYGIIDSFGDSPDQYKPWLR
ncbi:plasmid pRiA4b ORF-3 family protein [Patescibacteria group bacterium]|nr:plasmid pRiA4b ORF-3 family protein [Patescibacteria group bacterium]